MSQFSENPFADPFSPQQQQPAAPAAQPPQQQYGGGNNTQAVLDEYNPFQNQNQPQAQNTGGYQPPPQNTGTQPPPYSQQAGQAVGQVAGQLTAQELQRRQEELERKAADLNRKEQDLNRQQAGMAAHRVNNFPPVPQALGEKFSICKPCFYHDISTDIPVEFQQLVRRMYQFWMAHCILMFLNFIGALAFLIVTGEGTVFGLSILGLVACIPLSFICWYRAAYKAFRDDSSFNFFMFFIVMMTQTLIYILQAIGINSVSVGFFNGISTIKIDVFAGIIMLVIGAAFAVMAAGGVYFIMKVHGIYRASGASLSKAQTEFQAGVFSNQTVQKGAAQAAGAAAQGAMSGNRY